MSSTNSLDIFQLSDSESAAPNEPLIRVRMLIAYDGSSFHGFAPQKEQVRTVAGELQRVLSLVLQREPEITCAGRTDAGVHAWGQVISFDITQQEQQRLDVDRLQYLVNKQLAPAIVVREANVVAGMFNARFSARARRYRYSVLNTKLPTPFLASTTWWVSQPLDLAAMNQASRLILGEHDFAAFCRRPTPDATLVRNINSAQWLDIGDGLLRFDIEANAFCHQMVRSLTGMLVDVGKKKRSVDDMRLTLDSKDRQKAATLAPPQGLCLWEVLY